MNLAELGWNTFFEDKFGSYKQNGLIPARISQQHKTIYLALCEHGEITAEVAGRVHHGAAGPADYPTVGDWVAISYLPDERKGIIQALLPRKSAFVRNVAGEETARQVVASNIDTIFIVNGLDGDYNLRRIERYLAMAWESGAVPVIILNKADLCENIDEKVSEVESPAIGVPVHAISATRGQGLDIIRAYLSPGTTAALLGSSGVGKSCIINKLLGEERLRVNEVREWDSRGRHTTTYRQMLVLPEGGIIIDTPGMRLIKLWGDEDSVGRAFEDIEELGALCRFRDCEHMSEPGCAVQVALVNGSLDRKRYESYLKLKKELRYLEARQAMKPSAFEKMRWKQIAIYQKHVKGKK
ncbi:MAG: ribosome small subunit-dependent GTPase A [candidate division Zixibacteria bacterium RBG_16_53_22]|nr:MAG: ribosome small subunit-dependent GTPase A [candidate division Zixibacteria bacterium RBG_16_53_22]